jgi:hypothetical protein
VEYSFLLHLPLNINLYFVNFCRNPKITNKTFHWWFLLKKRIKKMIFNWDIFNGTWITNRGICYTPKGPKLCICILRGWWRCLKDKVTLKTHAPVQCGTCADPRLRQRKLNDEYVRHLSITSWGWAVPSSYQARLASQLI